MRQEQHEPTDDCADHHCFAHHVDEPLPARYYALCPECGHLYRTRRALLRAYRRALLRDWRHGWSRPALRGGLLRFSVWAWCRALFLPARKIYSCPFCIHDF